MERREQIFQPGGAEFTFTITPKSSIDDLRMLNDRSQGRMALKRIVTSAMIKNGEEVLGGEETQTALDTLKYRNGRAFWEGTDALVKGHASMVGRVAIAIGVGMDDPLMVFASSDFFARTLTERAVYLEGQFAKIGTEIKFPEEKADEMIEERRSELNKIKDLSGQAEIKVDAFINAALQGDEKSKVIAIIRRLIRVPTDGQTASPNERQIINVLKSLAKGKIDEASEAANKKLYLEFGNGF